MIKRLQLFRGMMFGAASLVLLASCSKEEDAPATTSFLRAKVNGTQFTATLGGKEMVVAANMMGMVTITGTNGSMAEGINIVLQDVTQPGTYEITPTSESVLSYTTGEGSFDTFGCSDAVGTVVVTSIDANKIAGTFTFTGKKSGDCTFFKNVTEGSFKANFMKQ